jgi:hypothetical protein
VQQLGDLSFENRAAAESELIRIGISAREHLLNAGNSSDLEIRYRAARALDKIERRHHARLIEAFLANPDDDELARQLPGWKRYAGAVGEGRTERVFFAGMQQAERNLLRWAAMPEGAETDERVGARILEIKHLLYQRRGNVVSAASIAAAIFAASAPERKLSAAVHSAVYSLTSHSTYRNSLQGGKNLPGRLIIGPWVALEGGVSDYIRLKVAMRYDLPQGVAPARRVIKAGGQGSSLFYALLAFGKCGSTADLPLLEDLLDDRTILIRPRGGKEYHVEARDVALLAALTITGQDHRNYGYPRVVRNSTYLYSTTSCGFNDDAQREAALRKWKEWKVSRPADRQR